MSAEPQDVRPALAVRAMRARGIDNAEELLECATPERILAACKRWDARQGVGPGLLAKWIRGGGIDEDSKAPTVEVSARLRATFDEYAARFPEGRVAESHARLLARRWPDDRNVCGGELVVLEARYPSLIVRCGACGFEATYPAGGLYVLDVDSGRRGAPA